MNLTYKSLTNSIAMPGRYAAIAAAFLGAVGLAGCDGNNQFVAALQGVGMPAGGNETAAPPQSGVKPVAPAAPALQNTGTAMGAKTMTIDADLRRLGDGIDRRSAEFHRADDAHRADVRAYAETVRAIEARLKAGSAPADPALVAQDAQARRQLDRVAEDVAQLNAVGSEIASEVAFAAYVEQELKSAATFEAAPEDQRQLAALRPVAAEDRAVAARLADAVNTALARGSASLADERRHLAMVDTAVRTGHAVAPAQTASASPAASASHRAAASAAAHTQRPLVIIRFDRPDVPYQQVLYTAVKRALERRPDATFDLVAVSPARDDEAQLRTVTTHAQRDAEDVLHTLSSMGLPAGRVRVSAMMSSEVATNEVQIFVR